MARFRRREPDTLISERLRACRESLRSRSIDGYLTTGRTDGYYLTGFDGEDGAVLILPRKVYLLTDGRFEEEAARSAPWATAVIRTGSLASSLARLLKRHRVRRLGFEPEQMTVAQHTAFRKAIRPARLVRLPKLTMKLRLIKDDAEIKAIEQALRVAEDAFTAVIGRLRLGATERDIASELEHQMIRRGASGASFPIIVAEGPNSSLPHATPGRRRIRRGSAVLIDWGATVDHYRSDLTRVIFIRTIPPRFRRMYEHVLSAQAEGIRAIAPGMRMGDVDAAARNPLARAGMGRRFSHSLGHGLGLDIHEPPRLARNVTDRLKAGMVVTVEPGVYFPGIGGVRIEDDVLVTENGRRVLSRLPKELDAMVVQPPRRAS